MERKLVEVPEDHTHYQDAGTNNTVVGDPESEDGALCGIHDEPDIGFRVHVS